MEAWGNFWQKGHSTTFGEYYADGYTKGYISEWWKTIFETYSKSDVTILEVGCGNASLLPSSLDIQVTGSYHGVDAAEVQLSEAVKTRLNDKLLVNLSGKTKIEDYQPKTTFDLIASVYGVEYSNLNQTLPSLKSLLKPNGQIHFLMHHAGSVITEMSKKALTEFDFGTINDGVEQLTIINSELNRLNGKLNKLQKSSAAESARERVNQLVSEIMNQPSSSRNPIMVDFSVSLLGYFKKIQQAKSERKAHIASILPDFKSSKERFRQMVDVARDEAAIEDFKQKMSDSGFSGIIIEPLNLDGKPVAWKIFAK